MFRRQRQEGRGGGVLVPVPGPGGRHELERILCQVAGRLRQDGHDGLVPEVDEPRAREPEIL